MPEAKTPSASYLPGQDPDIVEANRRYQLALEELTSSLDNRKRMFDPTLLAMAQGFLAPTQTGGFGESLSHVAKNVGAAQEAEEKRNQELLEKKLGVASQGLELQRLKARDAELAKYLGEGEQQPPAGPLAGPQAGAIAGPQAGPLSGAAKAPEPVSAGPLTAAPSLPTAPAAPETPEAPSGAGPLTTAVKHIAPQAVSKAPLPAGEKPPGFESVEGVQVVPSDPSFMTAKDYIRLNRFDKSKSPGDLIKEAQEINQKRYRDKEGGVLDLATGKYYQYPTGKTEKITIHGYKGTHEVDARAAALLSLYAMNNDPRYWSLAERIMKGPDRPGAKPEGKGDGTTEQPTTRQSVEERAIEQKEAESRAGKMGEKAAEKEAAVEENDATARRIYGSTTRVSDYLKQSPNYFGIFARPGVTAAIGNLIKEGIQTPGGTLNLAGFEDSMRKMMPGVTQKDLDNATKAATELAEIELAFTRMYLAKQGAVTEGERKIVRAIPGTVSNSPDVLKTRMELLKARSQYDIDVADAFRQWQDKNPGRSYFEFERKSDLYKQIKKGFEEESEKIFGGIKAVPTRQRKEEGAAAAKPGLDAARERVRQELEKK